ncbi:uncharacterized protein J3R85_005193 [Psidium guajava]|nr:uncharacterized protein J3R85_005193 [Psidium guajava]
MNESFRHHVARDKQGLESHKQISLSRTSAGGSACPVRMGLADVVKARSCISWSTLFSCGPGAPTFQCCIVSERWTADHPPGSIICVPSHGEGGLPVLESKLKCLANTVHPPMNRFKAPEAKTKLQSN